jgi:hypothetical protein
MQPSILYPGVANSFKIVAELITWDVRRQNASLTGDDLPSRFCTKSSSDKNFVALRVMVRVELPSVSVDPESVLTRPVINGKIEVFENIFLFPCHNLTLAISAKVDDLGRIVDVAMNLGNVCAVETH